MADLIIAGELVEGSRSQQILSPWDQTLVSEVGLADAAQIELAVEGAHRCKRAMADLPSYQKRDFLGQISHKLKEQRDSLAQLIARESGKPILFARTEVDRAVQTFAIAAEESTRLGGDVMSLDLGASSEGTMGGWIRVPSGPVLAITPFNFPLNLVAHKLAPAFALGCPVVLKPAPQTPLTSLALGKIVRESGAPKEILSVVPSTNELAEHMVRDERFAVVSFTGSAKVGWSIKERAGKKRTLLELGGNAAAIVEPDADFDYAIDRLVNAGYGYAGQVCIKTQRIFVHESIAKKCIDALVARVSKMTVGDPMDEKTICGPLIDSGAATRIATWLQEAQARGAKILVGGKHVDNRMDPTLVIDAPEGTRLVDEEVFGPVVTVHPYRLITEAFESIERGKYGLQAAIFTQNIKTIAMAFRSLSVGALVVNDGTSFRVDNMPYGGVKDSGLGREGVRYAIDEMSEKRLLVIRNR